MVPLNHRKSVLPDREGQQTSGERSWEVWQGRQIMGWGSDDSFPSYLPGLLSLQGIGYTHPFQEMVLHEVESL